jgi:glutamate/tyrosine decarboxylase-like PLP-dependent enzyme
MEEGKMDFAIHVDAAFYGAILPVASPYKDWNIMSKANSISISFHKFFGHPYPSGICLTTDSYLK